VCIGWWRTRPTVATNHHETNHQTPIKPQFNHNPSSTIPSNTNNKKMVSRELERECVVVFDEAHNIDNVCIEALSVNLRQQTLRGARANVTRLENVRCLFWVFWFWFVCRCQVVCSQHAREPRSSTPDPRPEKNQAVRDAQRANRAKLDAEYQRLVQVGYKG
jgi:Rad3-related DNA helicase